MLRTGDDPGNIKPHSPYVCSICTYSVTKYACTDSQSTEGTHQGLFDVLSYCTEDGCKAKESGLAIIKVACGSNSLLKSRPEPD